MTGFRVAWGGAQVRYDVRPDLTCLGKVIGGGLPCAAYGGRRDLMEQVSPSGPVYQAGTLSGNPLAMAGGLATLEILQEPGAYETLERRSGMLAEGLIDAAAAGRRADRAQPRRRRCSRRSSSAEPGQPVTNFADATAGDADAYARFFHAMLDNGVYPAAEPV